jgi:hypothetical protein
LKEKAKTIQKKFLVFFQTFLFCLKNKKTFLCFFIKEILYFFASKNKEEKLLDQESKKNFSEK